MKGVGSQRICLDFHFADFAEGVIADFDPKRAVATWKEAGVEAVQFLLKDHWGNVYYESDLPKELAPRLKHCTYDITGTLLEELKKAGMGMVGYFTINWDENYARRHPEHCRRDSNGAVKRQFRAETGSRMWTFLCINSPYREFVFEQSKEVVSKYDFPAFFSDILHFGPCLAEAVCYCEYCQRLWKRKYGGAIPKELDAGARAAYLELRDEFLLDFTRRYTGGLRGVRPDMLQTINIITDPAQIEHIDYVSREAEPWGKDFYSGSIQARVYRALARGKPYELLACRFNQLWDFSIKPEAELMWEAATITANQAEIMIIDQSDLRGNLFPQVYELIGSIYRRLPALRKEITDAEPVAEIGLVADGCVIKEWPVEDFSFNGASRMLIEMQLPFRAIISDHLGEEDLSGLQLVILSNLQHLSASQADALRDYLESGGCILMTAATGTFDARGLPAPREKTLRSLLPDEKISTFAQNFVQTRFPLAMPYLRTNSPCFEMEPPKGAAVLADLVHPAVKITDEQWLSHNIHPSPEASPYAAIFSTAVGKGTLVYVAFDLFRDYIQQDLPSFRSAVEEIIGPYVTPSVRGRASDRIEMNFYRTGRGDVKVALVSCSPSKINASFEAEGVAISNKTTEHMNMKEVYPACDVEVEVRGRVKGATSLQNARTSFEYDAERDVTTVTLQELEIYDCLTISK
jgi:hypothetical protein